MKIRIIKTLILILTFSSGYAQNTELKNLIVRSFTFNSKVKELDQSTEIAENRIEISRLGLLPTVAGSGSYNYINRVSTINGNKIQPNNALNFNVGINYVAFDFGLVKANINKTRQELQLSKDNAEALKSDLAYQIGNLYYDIVYTKNAISIQDSVLRFLTENLKDINTKIKFGDALQYDFLTIQSTIDQEMNRKADLENTMEKQFNLMEFFTGVGESHGNEFDFSNLSSDPETILAETKKQNIDFILVNDRIKIAKADRRISASQNRPTFSLIAGEGYRNGFTPEINNLKLTTFAGVNLSIPIWNGGRNEKLIRLSENNITLQKITLETLESTFNKDIKQAILDINTSRTRLQNVDGQIKQGQLAKELAQIRFKGGVGTNLELTNASTNLQKAELSRLQYKYQLCVAELELARLKGSKFWVN